ncbi:hypothetical protein CLU81_0542 [Flavobacterium sp. 9]|nr:hypothetical protein CLU81_0542 [Flavobacterium sp. 9]
MRKSILTLLLLPLSVFLSFSQTKTINNGTYITTDTNVGQRVELKLLDNNRVCCL